MTSEQLSRLFEKFVRFESHTEATRSTGLGLFITREIITKHHGEIQAESEAGPLDEVPIHPASCPSLARRVEDKGEGEEDRKGRKL